MSIFVAKTFKPITIAKNSFDAIVVVKAHDECSYDIILARTEASTCHDATFKLGWIEEYFFPRPSHLEVWRYFVGIQIRLNVSEVRVIKHVIFLTHKGNPCHGRGDAAFAQSLYGKIEVVRGHFILQNLELAQPSPSKNSLL